MRIGSLFSGAGGLDMAVAEVFAGEVVWHSEIDKAASKVLAHRFPGVPNLGSVTEIDWAAVKPVDVLCGGFPCQDVSVAGMRAGIKDGTRSGLWSVFAAAIDALRPRYVVIENVRGLLSATAHRAVESDDAVVGDRSDRPVLRAIGAVLGDLSDIGYDARWTTVAAASVGAPHRRERVFIVAHTSGATVGQSARSASAKETRQSPGNRSGNSGGERTVADGRQGCGCGDRRIDHDWFANPDRFDDGGCRRCRCESFWPAANSSGVGWDEGRSEPARLVGGFDAAVSGGAAGRVKLLPTSGMTRSGRLLPLPASAHPIGGNECLSLQLPVLFPTPTAKRNVGNSPGEMARHTPQLGAVVADLVESTDPLLPTPSTHDSTGPRSSEQLARMDKPFSNLNDVAFDELTALLPTPSLPPTAANGSSSTPTLLSTPQARDFKGVPKDGFNNPNLCRDVSLLCTPSASDGAGGKTSRSGGRIDEPLLGGQVRKMETSWGKYAAAIGRWEHVAGPAPTPTELSRRGNPRLNPAFSEWMMGWPAGWVTDPNIGISRNDQLRIIGNGVVSIQAEAALRYLLAVAQ